MRTLDDAGVALREQLGQGVVEGDIHEDHYLKGLLAPLAALSPDYKFFDYHLGSVGESRLGQHFTIDKSPLSIRFFLQSITIA